MQVVEESSMGSTEESVSPVKMETVYEKVSLLVTGNAVVIFTISGCCMCHVVKQLLFGLGVGPTIVELDRDDCGRDIHGLLFQQQTVPAVFRRREVLGWRRDSHGLPY
ncbi:putative glutaredoxin-C12 [Forsythia ovata]|uniref:Glutaredoxin-C12 n=1 Tax=Forsythia ovata TaxID=205694 RepID=A0ABD1S1B3_9LAMI